MNDLAYKPELNKFCNVINIFWFEKDVHHSASSSLKEEKSGITSLSSNYKDETDTYIHTYIYGLGSRDKYFYTSFESLYFITSNDPNYEWSGAF